MTAMSPNCGHVAGLTFPPSREGRCAASPVHPHQETPMNWDQIQGDWMQFKNKVRMNWVKLTDEDLTRIGGRREVLARTLQARYGFARAEAEREIDAWMKTQRHAA
jgi:uncharacterized protein YjbJ (UPF0337 family)